MSNDTLYQLIVWIEGERTPEDIVQRDPEKYRALILYVANYK